MDKYALLHYYSARSSFPDEADEVVPDSEPEREFEREKQRNALKNPIPRVEKQSGMRPTQASLSIIDLSGTFRSV